ncbi:hypothetical protein Acr_06g0013980 [Actinidia rufa]|uniref:Uncharacterized protein n=1 Tax=Actinidia rufa TaxID=165716 RepID=A0A7J0ESL7_9ERIC|nr:hypothetical protein Acr_06g0013980 [Actinidia rufa]
MDYRYKVNSVIPCTEAQYPCTLALLEWRSPSSYRYRAKLGEPPRQNLEQSLPKIVTIQAKAIVTSEISLFSKIRIITALELGRQPMATAGRWQSREISGDRR